MEFPGTKRKEEARNLAFAGFVQDAENEQEVSRFMKAATLGNVHVDRGDIDDAIAFLLKTDRTPQRLLVDISESQAPLDDLDRLADACEPSVQVYVLGDRNDVGLYRNLLQRGVRDYLVKPVNAELLKRILDEENPRQSRHGKIIAVAGTRGGVGASTVAAQLARRLAEETGRRRVAYVDLDIYGGSGPAMLGMAGGDALLQVLEHADRFDPQALDRALVTKDERLYVLASELPYHEVFRPEEGVLGHLLETLGQLFHYIVIDIPVRGGALVTEALEHSNIVCIVTDFSIHSARALARMAQLAQDRPRPPTLYAISNCPRSNDKENVPQSEFTKTVVVPVTMHIPYDPRGPMRAENLGEPLPERSEFAKAISQLSGVLTGGATVTARTQRGLLARLGMR